jgi:hypothetical protein
MSSGDYTSVRKMKQMYSHQNDSCKRYEDYGKRFDEFMNRINEYGRGGHRHHEHGSYPLGFNHNNGIGYYLPHSNCDDDALNPPVIRTKSSQLVATNKYHTKTIKAYRITPIKHGFVTFTVDVHLHNFAINSSISCYSDTNNNNFFEGTIHEYNSKTGEMTISDITSINGIFTDSAIYNIALLTLNPDIIQLKNRMSDLYQYFFQVDLEVYPNYNPVTEQLILFGSQISQLYLYFFNIDLSNDPEYEIVTYEYLTEKMNYLYYYFFELDITKNDDFNPNGNGLKLFSIKTRIEQFYLYLFNVNLSNDPYFNPNLI